ncbi:hypothetical protein AB6N24_01155, partial [Cellulomonas sp. 179-A 4D5 NHS]
MPESLSIVAGGTAAVVLLGVGVSALFAEPNESRGAVAEPMVVTVPPVIDPAPASPPRATEVPTEGAPPVGALDGGEVAEPTSEATSTALPPVSASAPGSSGAVRQDDAAHARRAAAGSAPGARGGRGTPPRAEG